MVRAEPDLLPLTCFEFAPDSWQHSGADWDLVSLVDSAAAAAASTSMSEFAQCLVGLVDPTIRLRSSETVLVGTDGGLHHIHAPSDADLLAWAVVRVWDSGAVSGRLREGTTLAQTWKAGATGDAIACLPLLRESAFSGVIAVWLTAPDPEAALQCVARLTLVSHLWSRLTTALVDAAGDELASASQESLTVRQVDILRAMATGCTNRQIARQIDFSESTVRLESMKIYKHYGVHSRSHAVQSAREAGDL